MWAKRKKIEKCIWCETTKIRHKGNGLCLRCFDKKRLENPRRNAQVRSQQDRYYARHKDNKEFRDRRYQSVLKFQKTSTYKKWLKDKYKILSYKRFLNTRYHNHWKNVIELIVNGKKIKAPLKVIGNQTFIREKEMFLKVAVDNSKVLNQNPK